MGERAQGRTPDELVESLDHAKETAPDQDRIQEALESLDLLKAEQLGRLATLTALKAEVEAEIASSVTASRELGATWSAIGEQMGVTGQAAQQRFDK